MYKITITKLKENPNYEKQKEEYDERRAGRYYSGNMETFTPEKYIVERVLEAELTEEEYAQVKKSVVEIM